MDCPKLPGLAPDGVIYANESMGTLEAFLPTGGYPTAHAPAMLELPDGAVWAMYTAQLDRRPGKDNMQYTSQVRCQKSTDGGRTWGPYETIFPEEGIFCRQPIQVLSNGRWIFANWLCTDPVDGLSGDPTAFRVSDDQGKTWRKVMMPRSNGRVHANVVELENGRRLKNADCPLRKML